jgi:hypothetical protein
VALWGDRATKFDADECMGRGKDGPIVILLCAVTSALYQGTHLPTFETITVHRCIDLKFLSVHY